jgi:hypothetical protein
MERKYPSQIAAAPEVYPTCHHCGATCIMGSYSVANVGVFCSPKCKTEACVLRGLDPWLVNRGER